MSPSAGVSALPRGQAALALPRGTSDFAAEMMAGLAERPRRIAPKFFYDETGSALFERICELPEYYLTRTELRILRRHAREIAGLIGPEAEIMEFGAGASTKIRILLDALESPRCFIPIDISGAHLRSAAAALARDYPHVQVHPVEADFTRLFALPAAVCGQGRRIGFLPGSSIGNFEHAEALGFLRKAAGLLRGGGLLIGTDMVKDPALLHAAYNDAQGVTAAFNRNLLVRANRELGGDFEPQAFDHYAFYEPRLQRVEMHLVSRKPQLVSVLSQRHYFAAGDSIHTENSQKYTRDSFFQLASEAGFMPMASWTDEDQLFAVHWLEAPMRQSDLFEGPPERAARAPGQGDSSGGMPAQLS